MGRFADFFKQTIIFRKQLRRHCVPAVLIHPSSAENASIIPEVHHHTPGSSAYEQNQCAFCYKSAIECYNISTNIVTIPLDYPALYHINNLQIHLFQI